MWATTRPTQPNDSVLHQTYQTTDDRSKTAMIIGHYSDCSSLFIVQALWAFGAPKVNWTYFAYDGEQRKGAFTAHCTFVNYYEFLFSMVRARSNIHVHVDLCINYASSNIKNDAERFNRRLCALTKPTRTCKFKNRWMHRHVKHVSAVDWRVFQGNFIISIRHFMHA